MNTVQQFSSKFHVAPSFFFLSLNNVSNATAHVEQTLDFNFFGRHPRDDYTFNAEKST